MAVITKASIHQRTIAIGTGIGTIAFYLALEYAGFGDPYGFYYDQIDSHMIGSLAIVANFVAVIGISILIIWEARTAASPALQR